MKEVKSFEDLAEALVILFRHYLDGALSAAPNEEKPYMYAKVFTKPALAFCFVFVDEVMSRYQMRDVEHIAAMLNNVFRLALNVPDDQASKHVVDAMDAGLEAVRASVDQRRSLLTIAASRAIAMGQNFQPWQTRQRDIDDFTLVLMAS